MQATDQLKRAALMKTMDYLLEDPRAQRHHHHGHAWQSGASAHCTDLQEQESVEHLRGKCRTFADEWAPVAERMWNNPADPRHPYRADITANMADTDKDKFTAQGRTFEKMTE